MSTYRFVGQLMKDAAAITDIDEQTHLTEHLLHALDAYEQDGFRFVDVDASGVLTTGELTLEWSDYGVGGDGRG